VDRWRGSFDVAPNSPEDRVYPVSAPWSSVVEVRLYQNTSPKWATDEAVVGHGVDGSETRLGVAVAVSAADELGPTEPIEPTEQPAVSNAVTSGTTGNDKVRMPPP
jgi:hypothetical protein